MKKYAKLVCMMIASHGWFGAKPIEQSGLFKFPKESVYQSGSQPI
jgi:hypothetical protein